MPPIRTSKPAKPRTAPRKEVEEEAPAGKKAQGGKGADDSLSFADQILTKAPALASYTNLHKLNLTNCGLTSIGFVKEAKATLTWLKVEGNDLSAPNAWDGVEELSRLFVLNASNCKLTAVPSVVEVLLCLKALVISHNALTQLDHVRNLPDLNTIVVSNNALTSLPNNLTTLGSLKKISAAHNKLTPAGLPDLSLLSQLREIKFNDNPSLVSLPPHLSSWGKGSLSHLAEFRGKRAPGLEVVDLGNCGFEEWYDLAPLAGQSGIVNLVLKGTKVAEEAKVDGFEDYKSKITILLPALRILDGQRFDAKFFDLKEKRNARPALVDEAAAIEVETPTASTSAVPLPAVKSKSKRAAPVQEGEPTVAPKKSKRKAAAVEEEEMTVESALKYASEAAAVDGEGASAEPKVVKKKKKNRHAPRHADVVEASPDVPVIVMETKTKEPSERKAKRAKAKGKSVEKVEVAAVETVEPPRKKRDKRGVLGALRGDDKEEAAARRPPPGATGANAIAPTPPTPGDEHTQKEKTSVLSVVVVKKDKGEAKKVVDLSSLLGGSTASLSGW